MGILQRVIPAQIPPSESWGRRYYGRSLSPATIESAIRNAEMGLMTDLTDLEDEALGLDLHASGVLNKRFGGISGLPWDVVAAKGTGLNEKFAEQIANETLQMLKGVKGFPMKLRLLSWGLFHGRSVLENHWRLQPGRVRFALETLEWVAPRRISFGAERELRLIEGWCQTGFYGEAGIALRDYPGKFTTWVPPMFATYPEKDGLGPRMMYWCFFKRFSWRMRMILTEIFALPWRIVEAEPDATVSWDQLKEVAGRLENLGQDSTAALPPGSRLNITTPSGETADLFQMTHSDVNLEISKLVLGNTGTTEGDQSNRASSVIQKSEQDLLLLDDAAGVAGAIQSGIIEPFVWLNWREDGVAHCPEFRLVGDTLRDIDKELGHAEKLLEWGLDIAEQQLRELTGWRVPAKGESAVRLIAAPEEGAAPATTPAGPSDADDLGSMLGKLEDKGTAGASDNADKDLVTNQRDGHTVACNADSLADAVSDELPGDESAVVQQFLRAASDSVNALMVQLRELPGYEAVEAVLTRERDLSDLEWQIFEPCLLAAMQGAESSAIETGESPARTLQLDVTSLIPPWLRVGRTSASLIMAIKRFLKLQIVTRCAWDAMLTYQKSAAFTVAHLLDTRAIELIREELVKSAAIGIPFADFLWTTQTAMVSAGVVAETVTGELAASHLETVFRNGVMSAYADGRQRHMTLPEVVAKRPYWQVQGVRDSRQRPAHRAAHGVVMRASDPGWQVAVPPFGHNCRCRLVARSEEWVSANAPTTNTGALPGLPDPGWATLNPPPFVDG